MRKKLPIADCRLPIDFGGDGVCLQIENRKLEIGNRHAFSLLEVLVVVALLSLIVIALMTVFSSTQRAFRASVTQTDVLEGGRAAVDLITTDLRTLSPSGGVSNFVTGPVNFFVVANSGYTPMPQSLTASPSGSVRYNLLNTFFVLGRNNDKWTAVGYAVNATNTSPLYPLYRFYAETNINASPLGLYYEFVNDINSGLWGNLNHVVDGVVHLTLRAYDPNGMWINPIYPPYGTNAANTELLSPFYGEAQLFMFSNTVPASVELELGVLEDRTLARAESRGTPAAQWNYLTNQVGALHLFRQRVSIPNVDASAYQ